MATFKLKESDHLKIEEDGKNVRLVKKTVFEKFNQDLLGLGDIESKSIQVNALSAIFDLEGFTNFCKQIDPQLAVPDYLSDFLKWLFEMIRKEVVIKEYPEGYRTYADLPFLCKYLGDGVLFLWDTNDMSDTSIRNVVASLFEVCKKYERDFLPKISKKIVSAPNKLRCGIARGTIYSVGDGKDYVGPCINVSARLQKLHSLTFCFSRRGIDPTQMGKGYKDDFIVKKVDIRGIGEEELVCLSKKEFDLLDDSDKIFFKEI